MTQLNSETMDDFLNDLEGVVRVATEAFYKWGHMSPEDAMAVPSLTDEQKYRIAKLDRDTRIFF